MKMIQIMDKMELDGHIWHCRRHKSNIFEIETSLIAKVDTTTESK